jgi:hypothetical protein
MLLPPAITLGLIYLTGLLGLLCGVLWILDPVLRNDHRALVWAEGLALSLLGACITLAGLQIQRLGALSS